MFNGCGTRIYFAAIYDTLHPFCASIRFSKIRTVATTNAAALKLGNVLLVASIAQALSGPGGTCNLENHTVSVNLSEDLVLQVLRRNSLDAFKKLEFFHWCSLKHNYRHTVSTYSQIFRTLSRCPRYHDEILNLLTSMRSNGVVLDSATYNLIIDSFIRSGKYDLALDHLEKDMGATSCLTPELFTSVLIALIRKNQLTVALQIFS